MKNGQIGLFYECGVKSAYENLQFISFPVSELFFRGTLTNK